MKFFRVRMILNYAMSIPWLNKCSWSKSVWKIRVRIWFQTLSPCSAVQESIETFLRKVRKSDQSVKCRRLHCDDFLRFYLFFLLEKNVGFQFREKNWLRPRKLSVSDREGSDAYSTVLYNDETWKETQETLKKIPDYFLLILPKYFTKSKIYLQNIETMHVEKKLGTKNDSLSRLYEKKEKNEFCQRGVLQ
jgi:hypothetical protein